MKMNNQKSEQVKARVFLDQKRQKTTDVVALRDLFGIWKGRDIDAQKLRAECQGLNT